MDTSSIKLAQTNTDIGLKLGSDEAPIKIVEFMNLRCPYCLKWFAEADTLLADYVAAGKVQRVIKLFNKEKPGLKRGNIMHGYIPYTNEQAAHQALLSIYETQEQWGNLSLEAVAEFAESNLNLTRQANEQVEQAVVAEAEAANIRFVPTIILNEHIFDESMTANELKALLDQALA